MADHRRYRITEEGQCVGRRCPSVRLGVELERQLPDPRIGDAGIGGSASHAEPAAIPKA